MKNLLKNLPASVRQTFTATLPLLIVLLLFFSVGSFGISKVRDVRSKIKQAEIDRAALTQKLSILQTLSAQAETGVGATVTALPDTNPALTVISQLKNLALTRGVILSSVKSNIGPVNAGGLSESIVSFTVGATVSQVIDFLTATSGIAPITLLDKIKMTENASLVRTDVSIKAYWAALPKTIPAVTQPIKDLSSGEKDALTKVSALIQPTFTQVVPSVGGVNSSPFGQ